MQVASQVRTAEQSVLGLFSHSTNKNFLFSSLLFVVFVLRVFCFLVFFFVLVFVF